MSEETSRYSGECQCHKGIPTEGVIYLVFRDLPGPDGRCVFVEAESPRGESIRIGEWRRRDDGFAELCVPVLWPAIMNTIRDIDALIADMLHNAGDHDLEWADKLTGVRERLCVSLYDYQNNGSSPQSKDSP